MRSFFKIFIIILMFAQTIVAQKYDLALISKETELNFSKTNKRGIEKDNIIYYVENDLQTLSAYTNNKLKWQTNIISVCGKPTIGKAEIRYIEYKTTILHIIFGKHSFAEVDTNSGKTKFIGAD